MRVRSATSALLLVAAPVVASLSLSAEGAENFSCGAGGRPNPRTARCDCPNGKIERTVGGTSRCVDKTAPTATTTAPTTAPTTTGTTTMPTTTSTATSTGTVTMPTVPTTPPPLPACPPGKMATAAGCVELCAPDELWNGATCAPRCGRDEIWNGARCERTSRPARPKCQDDQVADGQGHCCWPGQTWGEESGRCRGLPRCPITHHPEGETCKLSACEPGQHRVGDGVHCCWEGQEWSRATRACVGIPDCPEGYDLQGDRCVAWRKCDAMHVAIDRDHCCFPGQHWGVREDGVAGCAGRPRCGEGYVARGEECVSEEKAEADEDRELRSSIWGARMIGIGVAYGYLRAPSALSGHAFGYVMQYHFANVPLLFRGSLSGGAFSREGDYVTTDSGTSKTVHGKSGGSFWEYSIGVAFAPLSLPSASTNGTSVLNPFIGLDWYGIAYKQDGTKSDQPGPLEPKGASGALLTFGNTFSFVDEKKNAAGLRGGFALTFAYSIRVTGDAADRVDSRLMIAGMYSAY